MSKNIKKLNVPILNLDDPRILVSIDEYRKSLNDYKTPSKNIEKRLKYIEALCRNVIKIEIEKYVKTKEKN